MRKAHMILANICYAAGVFGSIYVGGWLMILMPVHELVLAFYEGTVEWVMVVVNAIKIFLSTTFGGLVWTVGYIGYNFFRGTEDPNWEKEKEQ